MDPDFLCQWCRAPMDRVCQGCGRNVCITHGSVDCGMGEFSHLPREGHNVQEAVEIVSVSESSDSEDGGDDVAAMAELHFTEAELQVGQGADVQPANVTYPSKDAAIAVCKSHGSLRLDGKGTSKRTGVTTYYLKCGKVVRVAKGQPRGEDGCPADYRVLQNGEAFTVEVAHRHSETCPNRAVTHGVGAGMRTLIMREYKTPYEAQTARIAELPNLKKLRNLFEYEVRRNSAFSELGEEAIRELLIKDAKLKRPASEHAWIDTLVVKVREWTVDRVGRRQGRTFRIPCTERVIAITTPQLAAKFAEYNVSGIDGTYGLATKHAVILNLGVYHERSFLPLLVAISSSVHSKVMDEETPIPKGESQRHYDTLLALAKELSPRWRPETFIRDAAPQIHNALETAFPGVDQVSCYFHFKQALDRWLNSIAGRHLIDRRQEILDFFDALHFAASEEDLSAGIELLKVHITDAALWRFLEAGHRLPGQTQSKWWFAGADHGSPLTACALERSNGTLKTYRVGRGVASIKNAAHAMCRFVLDSDTRTTFKSAEGVPRSLESYYIDERKERLLAWTNGLRLADLLETTFAITEDGVITRWALLDELPITYTELVAISDAKHLSWAHWKRWQSVRVFGTSWCECPQHQRTDFCKHVAAAQAHVNCMRAPPPEVIGARDWNRKVIKRRTSEELLVLRMLQNVSQREARAESKRQRSPSAHLPPLVPPLSKKESRADSKRRRSPSAQAPPPTASNNRSPLRVIPGNSDMVHIVKTRQRSSSSGYVLQ